MEPPLEESGIESTWEIRKQEYIALLLDHTAESALNIFQFFSQYTESFIGQAWIPNHSVFPSERNDVFIYGSLILHGVEISSTKG